MTAWWILQATLLVIVIAMSPVMLGFCVAIYAYVQWASRDN